LLSPPQVGSPTQWRVAGRLGAGIFATLVLLPPAAYGNQTDRNDLLFKGGLSIVALSSAAMVIPRSATTA